VSLTDVFLITVLLGSLSAFFTRAAAGTVISAAAAYWIAWTVLLLSGIYCEAYDLFDSPISETATGLILKSHIGVILGVFIASLISGRKRVRQWITDDESITSEQFLRGNFKLIVGILCAVACAHLIENISRIGLGALYGNLIYDLRVSALGRELSPLGLISSYLQAFLMPLAVVMARADRRYGFRAGRLAALIALGGLHGFGLGGRGFLAAPVIYYGVALVAGKARDGSRLPVGWRKGFGLMCGCLVAFSLLGAWRGQIGDAQQGSFQENLVKLPLGWIGSSLSAIEPASVVYSEIRMGGRLTFDGISSLLEKTRVLPGDIKLTVAQQREAIRIRFGNSASVIPPTAIPFLIGDVGEANLILYMSLILGICELLTIWIVPSSITKHVLAGLAFTAAALMIQGVNVLTGYNLVMIAWALVLDTVMVAARVRHQSPRVGSLDYHHPAFAVRHGLQ